MYELEKKTLSYWGKSEWNIIEWEKSLQATCDCMTENQKKITKKQRKTNRNKYHITFPFSFSILIHPLSIISLFICIYIVIYFFISTWIFIQINRFKRKIIVYPMKKKLLFFIRLPFSDIHCMECISCAQKKIILPIRKWILTTILFVLLLLTNSKIKWIETKKKKSISL